MTKTRGLIGMLTPEQLKAALEYDGDDTIGPAPGTPAWERFANKNHPRWQEYLNTIAPGEPAPRGGTPDEASPAPPPPATPEASSE